MTFYRYYLPFDGKSRVIFTFSLSLILDSNLVRCSNTYPTETALVKARIAFTLLVQVKTSQVFFLAFQAL